MILILLYLVSCPVPRPLSRISERGARTEQIVTNRWSIEPSEQPSIDVSWMLLLLVFTKIIPSALHLLSFIARVKVSAKTVPSQANSRYSSVATLHTGQLFIIAFRVPAKATDDRITVFIRGILGEVHTLDLPSDFNRKILFDLVESKTGVPARIMRLYLKQKAIRRNKDCQDLRISHGCLIDLLVPGNGGGEGSNVVIYNT